MYYEFQGEQLDRGMDKIIADCVRHVLEHYHVTVQDCVRIVIQELALGMTRAVIETIEKWYRHYKK